MTDEPDKQQGSPKTTAQFRYIGYHAQDMVRGIMLAPGDFVDLDDTQQVDEFNKRLIDEGLLIPVGS